MWELDHKEGWALKNRCFWVVLEMTLEIPLGRKGIKPVNPKGNHPWIFIGRTDAEAPKLWSPDGQSRIIGKDSDAGWDWGQEQKRVTELDSITDSTDINLSKLQKTVEDRRAWPTVIHRDAKSWLWLSYWITTGSREIVAQGWQLVVVDKHQWLLSG